MKRELLAAIVEAQQAKRAVALVTVLDTGAQALVSEEAAVVAGDAGLVDDKIVAAVGTAISDDRCRTLQTARGTVFLQTLNPPLRMVIVGAVHITQALAPMAALMGYEVTVIDPRRAFASPDRFPDLRVVVEWPDDALRALAPDRRTAVVTLTHDPKLDDPALKVALESAAFYIASLGSKRTHAARVERLKQTGLSDEDIARIHGPAGLTIGARSPAEIAAAILAQATQKLRGGK
ncbi:MAG: XdhC family protein, partial [Gammaproteobacteria bacterium]|nr:XdhC family protein [Gammaproteobacteria bacterium]